MTVQISDNTFTTTGVDNRQFTIGSNVFGLGISGTTVVRSSDNATFYDDIEAYRSMVVQPQAPYDPEINYNVTFLENRVYILGSGTVDESPFTSTAATIGYTGLYNPFHIEFNASYYDASNVLLHSASGLVYAGIQVNGTTLTLRSVNRNVTYASSGNLDAGNINLVNASGTPTLRFSSFTGAAAGSRTVWTYSGWESISGYF